MTDLEAAVVAWGSARTALMKASADGQGWGAELVSRLTATEDMLMVFRRMILERDPAALPGGYGPDPDFG